MMNIASTQNHIQPNTIDLSTANVSLNSTPPLSHEPIELIPSFKWKPSEENGNVIEGKILILNKKVAREVDHYQQTGEVLLEAAKVYYFIIPVFGEISTYNLSCDVIHPSSGTTAEQKGVSYQAEFLTYYKSNYFHLTQNTAKKEKGSLKENITEFALKIKFDPSTTPCLQKIQLKISQKSNQSAFLSNPFVLDTHDPKCRDHSNNNEKTSKLPRKVRTLSKGERKTSDLAWILEDKDGKTTNIDAKLQSGTTYQEEIDLSCEKKKNFLLPKKKYQIIFSKIDGVKDLSWTCYIQKGNEKKEVENISFVKTATGDEWVLKMRLDAKYYPKETFYSRVDHINPVYLVLIPSENQSIKNLHSEEIFIFSEPPRLRDFAKQCEPNVQIESKKIDINPSASLSDNFTDTQIVEECVANALDDADSDITDSDENVNVEDTSPPPLESPQYKETPSEDQEGLDDRSAEFKGPISKRRKKDQLTNTPPSSTPPSSPELWSFQPFNAMECSNSNVQSPDHMLTIEWRKSDQIVVGRIVNAHEKPLQKNQSNKIILSNGENYLLVFDLKFEEYHSQWTCKFRDSFYHEIQLPIEVTSDPNHSLLINFFLEKRFTNKIISIPDNKFYLCLESETGQELLSEVSFSGYQQKERKKRTHQIEANQVFSEIDVDAQEELLDDYEDLGESEDEIRPTSKKSKKGQSSPVPYNEIGFLANDIALTWNLSKDGSTIKGRLKPIGAESKEKEAYDHSNKIGIINKQYYLILPKLYENQDFQCFIENKDEKRRVYTRPDATIARKQIVKINEFALRITVNAKNGNFYSNESGDKEVHFRLHPSRSTDDTEDLISENFLVFSSQSALKDYAKQKRKKQPRTSSQVEVEGFQFTESSEGLISSAAPIQKKRHIESDGDCFIVPSTTTTTTTTTTTFSLPNLSPQQTQPSSSPTTEKMAPPPAGAITTPSIPLVANPTSVPIPQINQSSLVVEVQKLGNEFLWYRNGNNEDDLNGRIGRYFSTNNIKNDFDTLIETVEARIKISVLVTESDHFITLPNSERGEWNCFIVNASNGNKVAISLDKSLPSHKVRERYFDAEKEWFTKPKLNRQEIIPFCSDATRLESVCFLFESKDGAKTIKSEEFVIFSTYETLKDYENKKIKK